MVFIQNSEDNDVIIAKIKANLIYSREIKNAKYIDDTNNMCTQFINYQEIVNLEY